MPDLEEPGRWRLVRSSDPARCDHGGCDAEATRELRFGRIEGKAVPPARYCTEHADQVQALFHVDFDVVLEAAVSAD
jgi:hypothetical protein